MSQGQGIHDCINRSILVNKLSLYKQFHFPLHIQHAQQVRNAALCYATVIMGVWTERCPKMFYFRTLMMRPLRFGAADLLL